MKMRKFIAIILTIVMAASMLCTSAFATEAAEPTFRGAEIEAEAGETITYDVYIENNPGIAGYMVMVDFSDAAFDLGTQDEDDFENTLKISMGDFSINNDTFGNLVSNTTAYGCVALWFNVEEVNEDGTIFSVTLKVADDAINGEHAVKIRYDAVNTIDGEYNLIPFETIDGSVTVTGGVDGTINNEEVGPTEEELEQMEEGTLSGLGTPVEEGESPVQIETGEQLNAEGESENAAEDVDSPEQDSNTADGEGMNIMQLVLIIAAIVVVIVVAVLIAVKAKAKKAASDVIGVIPGNDDREMEIEEVMGWNDADDDEDDED